eukprot:TRINITY_DN1442_c0_g2_i1.p1 TRINITY_DN1442_c0_g2~~TRINITY_DN1442_c0_g2_i1.p1  ORF type:complete len:2718 (+),score=581.00 TRINITY_DN1442_c0_g2_i1:84-8237(+)
MSGGAQALLDSHEWSRAVGLPHFVEGFVRKALAERPADLHSFLSDYAGSTAPAQERCGPRAAAPVRQPRAPPSEPQTGPTAAAQAEGLPTLLPVIEESSPPPHPLATPQPDSPVRGWPPPGARASVDVPTALTALQGALAGLVSAMRGLQPLRLTPEQSATEFFGKVSDAALEAALQPEAWGGQLSKKQVTVLLAKAATSTSILVRKAAGILLGAFDKKEAAGGAEDSALKVPSKFDATDQVRGQARFAADDEEYVVPQPIEFFPQGYQPVRDPLVVVEQLQGWHDPAGRLWPGWAVQRLLRNCMLMIGRHSLGEPREVVVPLFTYSTFMFHKVTWGVWVPAAGGGKWAAIAPGGPWEQAFSRDCGAESLELSEGVARSLDKEVHALQRQGAEQDELFEGVRFPQRLGVVLRDGLPGAGGEAAPAAPYWGGLAIFRGENLARLDIGADSPTELGGSDCARRSFIADATPLEHVHLARFETPEGQLGSAFCPLNDTTLWLPMPGALLDRPPNGSFEVRGGGSMVQGSRRDDDHRRKSIAVRSVLLGRALASDGTLMCESDEGEDARFASMYRYPPPGVLEYILSRRSDERLAGAADGASEAQYSVSHASTDTEELEALCFLEKNQQQYSEKIYEKLRSKLATSETKLGEVDAAMLRKIIRLKTGHDFVPARVPAAASFIMTEGDRQETAPDEDVDDAREEQHREGLAAAQSNRPSPLAIAHSLDLQRLVWRGQSWYIAFSGKPFAVACQEFGCMPWFRIKAPFEDQPYLHLNASMRNLSFGKTATVLEVKQAARMHRRKRRSRYPDEVLGRYVAAQAGDAYGALTKVNPTCPWQVNWQKPGRQVHAVLKDNAEEDWRAAHSEADPEERAPYEHTARGGAKGALLYVTDRRAERARTVASDAASPVSDFPVAMSDATVDNGTWLLWQARPLLWQVDRAMRMLRPMIGGHRCAPPSSIKLYRGLQNVSLPPKVYARGRVVLWGQFSSSSKDQGVAQAFAGGAKASVFTLEGSSCRLIAPWSRFGREEEWLFPLNTRWLVTALLTEEQRQILDKSDTQLYEMKEITSETELNVLQVRSVLGNAPTAAAAGIIFQADNALRSGNGFLNLTLKRSDEGSTPAQWSYGTKVSYDGTGRCPVTTSTQLMACDNAAAETLANWVTRGRSHHQSSAEQNRNMEQINEGKFTPETLVGRKVLNAVASIMCIARPDVAILTKRTESAVEIKVLSTDDLWEVVLTTRRQSQRQGIAIKDDGARLLARIISSGVPLVHIDICNNDVKVAGATALLDALRRNRKVVQLKVDIGRVLEEVPGEQQGKEERACPLDQIAAMCADSEPEPTLNEIVQAINIRCLQHQGRIGTERLGAFGPGWPKAAAYALYDLPALDLDFYGLFRRDEESRMRRTEAFIVMLARQCIVARKKRPQDRLRASLYPRMPGALVAASITAPWSVIGLLLELGACVDETGDWGETALVKARRRLIVLKEGPTGDAFNAQRRAGATEEEIASVMQRLETKCPVRSVRPGASTLDVETWRLKNLALIAMQVWDEKVQAGFNVVDELVLNLKFPKGCTPRTSLKILKQIALSTLRTTTRGSLGKIPVDRARVSTLCYVLYCMPGERLDRWIADIYNESHRKAGEERVSAADLGNGNASEELLSTIRALHHPQAWGSGHSVKTLRELLGKWVCTWALLNCTLSSCPEDSRGDWMHTRLNSVPASAMHGLLSLRQGDVCTMSSPTCWRTVPHQVAEGQLCRRSSAAQNDAASTVHLAMSGRFRCEDVTALVDAPREAPLRRLSIDVPTRPEHDREHMLPGLMSFLVAGESFHAGSLHLKLISTGSLLDRDPEVNGWQRRVLTRAEWAETRFQICVKAVDDSPKDMEQVGRWIVQVQERQGRRCCSFAKAWEELCAARHQYDILRRVVDEEGSVVVRAHGALACRKAAKPAAHALSVLHRCRGPARGAVGRGSAGPLMYSADPSASFPYTKRPAKALMYQVRTRVPSVGSRISLLDLSDRSDVLEVSHRTVEQCHAACHPGDPAYSSAPDGSDAARLFGDESFRITIGETQQLVRSSTWTVMPDRMPTLFVAALIRQFTSSADHRDFISVTRHIPLARIMKEEICEAECRELVAAQGTAAGGGLDESVAALRMQHQAARNALSSFQKHCIDAPAWYGFDSPRQVLAAFERSVSDVASEVAFSQRGYFLTAGTEDGGHNRICAKTPSPVAFICISPLDFADPHTAARERARYFDPDADASVHGARGTSTGQALQQRLQKTFETIFTAAREQGAQCLSVGAFGFAALKSITDLDQRLEVKKTYYSAQYGLLCSEDWGFSDYFMAIGGEDAAIAQRILKDGLRDGGPYNNERDGLVLRCNVVFHDKCPKFLARELADRGLSPGYLVPCHPLSVLCGRLGGRWETGRGEWTDEEDWAATSTGPLGMLEISGEAAGLDDVVFGLADGRMLRVTRQPESSEELAGGVLCALESPDGGVTYMGPFRVIECVPERSDISFHNEGPRKSLTGAAAASPRPGGGQDHLTQRELSDASAPSPGRRGSLAAAVAAETPKQVWELDHMKSTVLRPLLVRLVQLAHRATNVRCSPHDLGTGELCAVDNGDAADKMCFVWIRAAGPVRSLLDVMPMLQRGCQATDIRRIHHLDDGPLDDFSSADIHSQRVWSNPGSAVKWIVIEFASADSAADAAEHLRNEGCQAVLCHPDATSPTLTGRPAFETTSLFD